MNQAQALTDNQTAARAALLLADPPPDIFEPVVAVTQGFARGRAMAAGEGSGELHLIEPPPDIVEPVVAVSQGAAAVRAMGGGEGRPAGEWCLADPPPDVVENVQVVAQTATAAALGDEVAPDVPLFLKEADYAEELADAPDPERAAETPATAPLSNEEIYRIIREVALADSGEELYWAVATDRDFAAGPAAERRQFGLCFGLVLFTQESGRLGSVLRLMRRRDPDAFKLVFGADADALVETTNAATPPERLRPVGGEPLWGENWVGRFRRAGEVPAFQAAQNEEIIEGQFRPMLRVAAGLGLTTDRCLAMVYDRVVTRGLGGGLRWVVQAAGPLRTAQQRTHALRTLGFDNVAQFQTSASLTPASGVFDVKTHAALAGALRRQGDSTLPSADESARRLYGAATQPARWRLRRLLDSNAFTDVAYDLGN
ncbi:MAG TPA: hypothetical protein VJ866_03850 [Pyrinomonadaceae bacterium]|nr:hypothetical protein [Pyrinomonadaceae bacterium]